MAIGTRGGDGGVPRARGGSGGGMEDRRAGVGVSGAGGASVMCRRVLESGGGGNQDGGVGGRRMTAPRAEGSGGGVETRVTRTVGG